MRAAIIAPVVVPNQKLLLKLELNGESREGGLLSQAQT